MDKSGSGTREGRSALGASVAIPEGANGEGLIIGIAREAETSHTKLFTLINIETGKDISIILLLKNNAGFLVGRLVVYDQSTRSVFWLENEIYSYRVIARFQPKPSRVQVECPACGVQVSGLDLADHLKGRHWFPGQPFGPARRE
jgi:hypothetical protein